MRQPQPERTNPETRNQTYEEKKGVPTHSTKKNNPVPRNMKKHSVVPHGTTQKGTILSLPAAVGFHFPGSCVSIYLERYTPSRAATAAAVHVRVIRSSTALCWSHWFLRRAASLRAASKPISTSICIFVS